MGDILMLKDQTKSYKIRFLCISIKKTFIQVPLLSKENIAECKNSINSKPDLHHKYAYITNGVL